MINYLLRRLLIIIPTLFGITLVTFTIIHLAPGDPVKMQYGGALSTKGGNSKLHLEEMRRVYHLDEPIIKQYGRWILRIVTLDFGKSMIDNRPVLTKIFERLPLTLYLNTISFILIFLISIPTGIYSALNRGKMFDHLSGAAVFILYSLPVPWIALMLLIYGGVELNIFPVTGIVSDWYGELGFFGKLNDILSHSILPVFCLTYGGLAVVTKLSRTSILETINKNYIRAGYARGLSRKQILFKHSLKNSLLPIITLFGGIFPALISGSVIIERIFTLPGIGQLFFESILYRDYTTIMGLSLFSAIMTLIGILVADILYAIVDPRITYTENVNE